MELLTLEDIQAMLKVDKRSYVRDRIVKRPDFPRPAVFVSQKCRRWNTDDVQRWMALNKESMAR